MTTSTSFQAKYHLDLAVASVKDFAALESSFRAWVKQHPPGPMPIGTGWHDIDQQLAEELLARNYIGGKNRPIDFATVRYYADQLGRGDWKPTGQPWIFDDLGQGMDFQHRAWAVYLSGHTMRTFVLCDVPHDEQLFAFMDNGKVRNAAAALVTAGYNGVSALIYGVIKLAEGVRRDLFRLTGAARLGRMAPIDVLRAMAYYPNAQTAARSAASDWKPAAMYIGGSSKRDVVAYLGMAILDAGYDEGVADDFFADLASDDEDRAADHAIAAARKEIDKNLRSPKPWAKHVLLACLIKTFNAWVKDEPLRKRWNWQLNEEFPAIVPNDTPAAEAEAA